MIVLLVVSICAVTLPYWLPAAVIALRIRLFARINGTEGIVIPGDLDVSRFMEVYSHPAADGRSRGAALSDLFWYWLSPGAEIHQEHLEPGPLYDEVARCTRRMLTMPSHTADRLAVESVEAAYHGRAGLVRLRDELMPVWAEFYHRVVFRAPCPPEVRDMIVASAADVADALKCRTLRHMDRRLRLTGHLKASLGEVPHVLPMLLDARQRALYLQGTFFTTAVVQSAEASAHVLMELARHPEIQRRAATDEKLLEHVIDETLRMYPLFGIAHRVTSGEIALDDGTAIPAGSVVCFDYLEYQRAGCPDHDRFDPYRRSRPNHIPFGVAVNRPCPAWHLAPLTVRSVVREILTRHTLETTAAHTRAIPNRAPCLATPSNTRPHLRRTKLLWLRLRDRWEDVGRSLTQLVLGTYMVWHARHLRLCERHFAQHDSA
ncbi:cytochrome P450 [Sphaerisporangium sp. B11E5]|uniref:cytochrome P450 n=1 Tax=Sphaerisporangium sp. B11E5 TaxID=3153563 RepID=UPI00325C6E72